MHPFSQKGGFVEGNFVVHSTGFQLAQPNTSEAPLHEYYDANTLQPLWRTYTQRKLSALCSINYAKHILSDR